jgi:hypothetical protein
LGREPIDQTLSVLESLKTLDILPFPLEFKKWIVDLQLAHPEQFLKNFKIKIKNKK